MEYKGLDFVAIDFETASGRRDSVCEAGICVVRDGQIRETRSWLVRPRDNFYSNFNIQIHGIRPEDTENSPAFPFVWDELSAYLAETPVLVAHNAAFDMSCIRSSLEQYGLPKPDVTYYCSLRAARHLYDFSCNKLDYLCASLRYQWERTTARATTPRCAHGFSLGKSGMPAGANCTRWTIAPAGCEASRQAMGHACRGRGSAWRGAAR